MMIMMIAKTISMNVLAIISAIPMLCNNAEHKMTKDCNEPDNDKQ